MLSLPLYFWVHTSTDALMLFAAYPPNKEEVALLMRHVLTIQVENRQAAMTVSKFATICR